MKKITLFVLMVFAFQLTFSQKNVEKDISAIRENFKKINAKENWTKIDSLDIWESAEGGILTAYTTDNEIKKIIIHLFGETFQVINEYYVLDGKLSFVFEQNYKYNMPDRSLDKSQIIEDRSYFKDNKLIRQLCKEGCDPPFSKEYIIDETKRLLTDFEKYHKLAKDKTND